MSMKKVFLIAFLVATLFGCRQQERQEHQEQAINEEELLYHGFLTAQCSDTIEKLQKELEQWIDSHSVEFKIRVVELNPLLDEMMNHYIIPDVKSKQFDPKQFAIYLYLDYVSSQDDGIEYLLTCSVEEFPEIENEEWSGYYQVEGFSFFLNKLLVKQFTNTTDSVIKFECIKPSEGKESEYQWKYRLVFNVERNDIKASKLSETVSAAKIAKVNMALDVYSFAKRGRITIIPEDGYVDEPTY